MTEYLEPATVPDTAAAPRTSRRSAARIRASSSGALKGLVT